MAATRLYTALLVLYPRAHRDEYGPDMVQLFAERYRDEQPTRDVVRFVGFWMGMIGDIVRTALAERTESGMTNLKRNWWKWAIGVFAAFQVVFAIEAIVGIAAGWREPQVHLIDAAIPVVGAGALIVGLTLLGRHPRAAGLLLTLGLLPVALAGVVFFWFPPMWVVSLVGLALITTVLMETQRDATPEPVGPARP